MAEVIHMLIGICSRTHVAEQMLRRVHESIAQALAVYYHELHTQAHTSHAIQAGDERHEIKRLCMNLSCLQKKSPHHHPFPFLSAFPHCLSILSIALTSWVKSEGGM